MSSPRLKICGITRRADAEAATREGAHYLGFVLVESSPRRVSAESVARLSRDLGSSVVVVTADAPDQTADLAIRAGASVVQLHGNERPRDVARLRRAGPWEVWKAIRMRDVGEALASARRFAEVADGILLDAWHPAALGGAGVTFAWEEAAELRRALEGTCRFVLAGGITPENVAEAMETLGPDVLDVSSGVESRPGIKDARKIRTLVAAMAAGAKRSTIGEEAP